MDLSNTAESSSSSSHKRKRGDEDKELENKAKKAKTIPEFTHYISFDVGTANMGYWRGKINRRAQHQTLDWKILTIGSGKSRIQDMVKGLVRELDALFANDAKLMAEIDECCIEQQPIINRKTQILSFAIQTYVLVRFQGRVRVTFVDPKCKLALCEQLGATLNKQVYKKSHTYNKQLGIKGVETLLAKRKDELKYFQEFDKQDDLADALLQALVTHQKKIMTGNFDSSSSDKPKKARKRAKPPKYETLPVMDEKPIEPKKSEEQKNTKS